MKIKNLLHLRSLILGAIIFIAAFVVLSDALYQNIELVIKQAESIIYRYPVQGILLFVILSMVSAMLAFYSSAILVPVGVYTWGALGCFILLWIGWILGGILSFVIGYYFGSNIASKLIGGLRFTNLENRINRHAKFIHILLFQAALPSEIPGYLLGALHYRFLYYVLALTLVELPYAIGTIYLGTSFLQRNSIIMLILGVAAVLVSTSIYLIYHRFFQAQDRH